MRMNERPIPHRQGLLLSLLDALGGRVANVDFQKLLLLFCQEPVHPDIYEFVPYHFGAFSFTSYADRRKLVARGLIVSDDGAWALTANGRRSARGQTTRAAAEHFSQRFIGIRGDRLVAETYRRFPNFAIRSEIVHQVLAGDPKALDAVAAARPATHSGICTIGYQGLSLEAYLNRLLRSGVTVLCDVRRNPLSRKYGFSKRTLAHACQGIGIRYEHLPELGIASAERRGLNSAADFQRLFGRYECETLRRETAAVARISGWVESGEQVALTCFEHRPNECHRLRVAWAVTDSLRGHSAVLHL